MRASPRSLLGLFLLVLAATAGSTWWASRTERSVGEQLASRVQVGDIRMLASDTCGVCISARAWFTEHRVLFSECSIERDAACRAAFAATGSPGTPVLVVRGQAQVGFNPKRLLAALPAGV